MYYHVLACYRKNFGDMKKTETGIECTLVEMAAGGPYSLASKGLVTTTVTLVIAEEESQRRRVFDVVLPVFYIYLDLFWKFQIYLHCEDWQVLIYLSFSSLLPQTKEIDSQGCCSQCCVLCQLRLYKNAG